MSAMNNAKSLPVYFFAIFFSSFASSLFLSPLLIQRNLLSSFIQVAVIIIDHLQQYL